VKKKTSDRAGAGRRAASLPAGKPAAVPRRPQGMAYRAPEPVRLPSSRLFPANATHFLAKAPENLFEPGLGAVKAMLAGGESACSRRPTGYNPPPPQSRRGVAVGAGAGANVSPIGPGERAPMGFYLWGEALNDGCLPIGSARPRRRGARVCRDVGVDFF